MPGAFCDCPVCPCHVPVSGARRFSRVSARSKKHCAECKRGNHIDRETGERAERERQL